LSAGLLPVLILLAALCGADPAPAAWAAPYPLAASPAELAARPELEKIQANIRVLEARLAQQATRFASLSGETGRLARERQVLEDELAGLTGRLGAMLPALWEMEVRLNGVMDASVAPWDESDRGLAWLGSVYGQAREDLNRLRLANNELAANLERQAGLKPEADDQGARTEATRDALLAERLKLLKELAALRRERPSPVEQLERILEQASLADFSPLGMADKPFQAARGVLPWPAKGITAAGFDPQASPPRNGVSLATAPGAKVTAVHWGRVAFAGEVKGLGHVVALAHGGGALTVYARLSSTTVSPGQEVARGAVLGAAGELAPGGASGMSFELRFGLKPINPGRWLIAG
jgi:septal ring factor EnvC (AmiA/AmiB activator)